MKKIIGWFKNVLTRILEVVNYMVKKDNELELAKLEFKKEITISVLSDSEVQKFIGCVALGLGIGVSIVGASLLYVSNRNMNTRQNILAN